MASEFAPAKVNLTLHVTGRRADGYHVLDSLVAFVGVGDTVSMVPCETVTLDLTGPQSALIEASDDNLVLRAARAMGGQNGAALTLDKHLPVASGIGGGSADAAATLRLLSRAWDVALPSDAGLSLGADVPVCLNGRTVRMRGIGDVIDPVPALPAGMGILLVNPRQEVSTPLIFNALASRENEPMPDVPAFSSAQSLCNWLSEQRNDLEPAAVVIAPIIRDVLDAISDTDCLLARMSGSGATCFGMFETVAKAEAAADALRRIHPNWWITASHVMGA